ncbi:NAD(P)H-binding protein [Streptomyces sp. NPDC059900]|uniref:NAD(P)H-binding protein n=1 Tax=Streptomyces sp. NPDC059900 TaxID=3155816 RepID=UPI003417AFC4
MTARTPATSPRAVVVTGATGAVGRHVARQLADHPGLRLLVRDPAKAAGLGLPGRIVGGDYDDPTSLKAGLDGADSVFVVTANPLRPAQDDNLLSAARAAGARHVVKLSWTAVGDPAADDLIAAWNRAGEDKARAGGLTWTVLRIPSPMSNTLSWASSIRTDGIVHAYRGDAATPCVDPRDIAAIAAEALTTSRHTNVTYAFAGPQALSAREQTAELSHVLGRPLEFAELTADQALERWSRRLPEPIALALLSAAERRGRESSAAPGPASGTHEPGGPVAASGAQQLRTPASASGAQQLRTPTLFRRWAQDHASYFH